jgi:putative transposase
MPASLSNDLRQRIIAAKEEGARHAQIAKELRVSVSTITRLLSLYRETGSHEARPRHAGRKPRLDEAMLQKIARRIGEQSDITLRELIEEFSLPVSAPALCKTINRKLGLGRKKNGARRGTTASRRGEAAKRVEGPAEYL